MYLIVANSTPAVPLSSKTALPSSVRLTCSNALQQGCSIELLIERLTRQTNGQGPTKINGGCKTSRSPVIIGTGKARTWITEKDTRFCGQTTICQNHKCGLLGTIVPPTRSPEYHAYPTEEAFSCGWSRAKGGCMNITVGGIFSQTRQDAIGIRFD